MTTSKEEHACEKCFSKRSEVKMTVENEVEVSVVESESQGHSGMLVIPNKEVELSVPKGVVAETHDKTYLNAVNLAWLQEVDQLTDFNSMEKILLFSEELKPT